MRELEAEAVLESESPASSVRTPRPGIVHLMLWTLCSASYMAWLRAIYALQGELPSEYAGIIEASKLPLRLPLATVLLVAGSFCSLRWPRSLCRSAFSSSESVR
jgi:hypothetical protein